MKKQLESNLEKLPEMCVILHPTENYPVILKRGEVGYWPAPGIFKSKKAVDKYNEDHHVTPQQLRAMEVGSMFGFHVPGADPDLWVKDLESQAQLKRSYKK